MSIRNEASLEASVAVRWLADYRRRADMRLAVLFEEKRAEVALQPFAVDRYVAHLEEYALRGGKRLRGALVELGFQAIAGTPGTAAPNVEAFEASLAFELLHAFLLTFDDVMDRDELRRGGPTLHMLAAREAATRGSSDPQHRGLSVTMLLGLVAQGMAFGCLERAGASLAVRRYFDRVTEGVTLGQLLDVVAVDAPGAGPQEIAAIHQLKTGLYTTEGPLVLGALLAGARADGPEVSALRAYAAPLGEAFQLVDDLLGMVGEPDETGKPASGDLREGKRTAVIEEALARLAGPLRSELQTLAGRPLGLGETARARALIDESGAVEAVRGKAEVLADRAMESLQTAPLYRPAASTLGALARLVVDRHN